MQIHDVDQPARQLRKPTMHSREDRRCARRHRRRPPVARAPIRTSRTPPPTPTLVRVASHVPPTIEQYLIRRVCVCVYVCQHQHISSYLVQQLTSMTGRCSQLDRHKHAGQTGARVDTIDDDAVDRARRTRRNRRTRRAQRRDGLLGTVGRRRMQQQHAADRSTRMQTVQHRRAHRLCRSIGANRITSQHIIVITIAQCHLCTTRDKKKNDLRAGCCCCRRCRRCGGWRYGPMRATVLE
jgi:hypothetical protein